MNIRLLTTIGLFVYRGNTSIYGEFEVELSNPIKESELRTGEPKVIIPAGIRYPVRGTLGVPIADMNVVMDPSTLEAVLDRSLSVPPVNKTTGDRYIVNLGGSGAWTGKDYQIAEWNGAAWAFTDPVDGTVVYVADEALYCWWTDDPGVWSPLVTKTLGRILYEAAVTNAQVCAFLRDVSVATTEGPAYKFYIINSDPKFNRYYVYNDSGNFALRHQGPWDTYAFEFINVEEGFWDEWEGFDPADDATWNSR